MKILKMTQNFLFVIVIIPQLLHANVITDFFSYHNDPYRVRTISAVAGITGIIVGSSYLINLYLKSPKRIKNKYQAVLDFYNKNKTCSPKLQYEKFNNSFSLSHSEVTTDIGRLAGQQGVGVQELKEALIELQFFIYHVETYVLKNKLLSTMARLEKALDEHMKIVSVSNSTKAIKPLILAFSNNLYPYIAFEQTIDYEIYTLTKSYLLLRDRSDSNDITLKNASNLIQKLTAVRSATRSLPEFRSEQIEREKAHQKEKIAQEKQHIEKEKLSIEREKNLIELAKQQNPTVVINNNQGNSPSTNPSTTATNPYLEGYYDKDGYYWS